VRATRANEIWHIDVSVVRFLDGSKAYILAVRVVSTGIRTTPICVRRHSAVISTQM